MRIFITGANGQLGYDCVYEALKRGYEVIGSDIHDSFIGKIKEDEDRFSYISVDITCEQEVEKSITDIPEEWVLRDVNGYRGKTVIMNKAQDNVLYVYSVTEAVSDTDRIVRYHCEYNEEYAIRPAVWIKASAVLGGN